MFITVVFAQDAVAKLIFCQRLNVKVKQCSVQNPVAENEPMVQGCLE